MPPDLNSLPLSRPPSAASSPLQEQPRRTSLSNANQHQPSPPSPRSLQATAALNAGLHRRSSSGSSPARHSPISERRRSSLLNNLVTNDDRPGDLQTTGANNGGSPQLGRRSLAASTADPHHRRPSLGQIHQELENEQEAQVNRLLHMIRMQQDQIAQIQRQQQSPDMTTEQTRLPAPSSAINTTGTNSHTTEHSSPGPTPAPSLPHASGRLQRPHSVSQTSSSRLSDIGNSPTLNATEDFLVGGTRDESQFYQAETHALTRENQMLKHRIRELERQISEVNVTTASTVTTAAATEPESKVE